MKVIINNKYKSYDSININFSHDIKDIINITQLLKNISFRFVIILTITRV